MISPRDDIDEPDIIDLTASVRSYHFVDPPLRPPSPFADEQRQTKRTRPKKPIIVTSRKNVIRSSSESRVQRIRSHWQQALHRLLKREKEELYRSDSSESRTSVKHVHWIDEDEQIRLRLCQNFLDSVRALVDTVLKNEYPVDAGDYVHQSERLLNQLHTLMDTDEIEDVFQDLIRSLQNRDQYHLFKHRDTLEDLFSRTMSRF